MSAWPAAQEARAPFVYVSGYRPEITIFRLDTAGGKLIPAGRSTDVGQEPSFLAFDPSAKFLFAVNETDPGRVRSFAINQSTGALTPINDVPSMGSITAHLSTDKTGRWLLVANYGDTKQGTIASIPIAPDGRLGTAVDTREFGLGSMAHYISSDPGNRFVFVPLKGGPAVAQLVFDVNTRVLTQGGGSIAELIAVKFGDARGVESNALIGAGLGLFFVTLLVNMGARAMLTRSRRFA